MAIDADRLAVVGDLAGAFEGFCAAFGLDGEDALGANQHMINVEFLSAGLDGDIVENGVAFCAKLLEELAHGLFGFDATIQQANLRQGLAEFPGSIGAHTKRDDGKNREAEGEDAKMIQPKINGHHYKRRCNGNHRHELVIDDCITMLHQRFTGIAEWGLLERCPAGFHSPSMPEIVFLGNLEDIGLFLGAKKEKRGEKWPEKAGNRLKSAKNGPVDRCGG